MRPIVVVFTAVAVAAAATGLAETATAQECALTRTCPPRRATPPRPPPPPPPAPRVSRCDKIWKAANRADNYYTYRDFVWNCPSSRHVATAERRMVVLKPPPPPSPPPPSPPPSAAAPAVNLGDYSRWARMFPDYNPSAPYAGDAHYAARLGKMLKQYGFRRNYWYATDRIGLIGYGVDVVSIRDEVKWSNGFIVYSVVYNGVIWFFSSEANLKKFTNNPSVYMPVYGGFCTLCLAENRVVAPNERTSGTSHGSRVYFDASGRDSTGKLLPYDAATMNGLIVRANANWVKLQPSNLVIAPQNQISLQISAAYDAR